MVNGHYIMYGDKPSSESEIVEDHVQTRTAERKPRRKSHRTANELQPSLAQLDNETDSVKYEKKNKEPRILRYVPNTEVEEHHVSDTFETYDLKTTDATPRRYAFKKKPKNPTDGSVNYAYSRSSSNCSSPTGNLPTISEHAESLPTHRAASPTVSDIITGYENKLDKYFNKPREVKYRSKGSHPDSLYRVPLGVGAGEGKMTRLLRVMRWPVALIAVCVALAVFVYFLMPGAGEGKMTRLLRVMRWPVALIAVCVALAVFVYFLMPDNFQTELDNSNATYWESNLAVADTHRVHDQNYKPPEPKKRLKQPSDTRTPEMDFYDADHSKNKELQAVISTVTDKQQANLPIAPVFPTHLSPEVQYGNENADTENLRSPKVLHKVNQVPTDSTLKPHITQKPEKPLAIYFKDGEGVTTTTSTEAASEAINNHLYAIHSDKIAPQRVGDLAYKPLVDLPWPANKLNIQPQPAQLPDIQEFYSRNPSKTNLNFTSGHSKLFGIGIEDAEKMQSTTQSSVYNTRVSPTLPTWRDGDDTTTKKYPVNVNQDVSQCRSTSQPLCRGVLPYDLAGKPVAFGGVSITSLLPQIEFVASTNCSIRFKTFICALLEPECGPAPYPPKMPCYNLCKAVMDGCEGDIPRELRAALNCKQYSSANCVAARIPCEQQELACGDGTCIPRDWMCDGALDCPGGEDESVCGTCQVNEFRCDSGTCIHSRWTCDGYADCPDGEDESEVKCGGSQDLGEEPAGSAPAPAVHRPNRVPQHQKLHRAGDDSSKELLITSDSNNALKRNFTRRPSLSRLTPYSPAMLQAGRPKKIELDEETPKKINKNKVTDSKEIDANTSAEDQTDLGNARQKGHKRAEEKPRYQSNLNPKNETKMTYIDIKDDMKGRAPLPRPKQTKSEDKSVIPMIPTPVPTQLDQSINKLERVIDGADLMKLISQKAQTPPKEDSEESIENSTTFDKTNFGKFGGKSSAHASPCPDGELRCVDGRCITLAQLCDGTIDCSDHADEDNCYS